ncbi:EF-hand domain-containing protein [Streptomyces sp. KR80]|uniref:EF-hand domain-containing protein n=1 Tax=Streptomyces sp. KR80 TaxID=3457426 RepID=UPI003FD37575
MDRAEYERKISRRFATFDQDGNGFISREDFHAAAAALLKEFDKPARSIQGQALHEGAEAFWQGMAGIADRDGDQRITRDEFVNGAVKRLRDNPGRFAEIARPFFHAAIAVAHSDAGSELTPEEAARVARILGVPEDISGKVAAVLDADGDGRITEDQVVSAFAAYYTTDEPDV